MSKLKTISDKLDYIAMGKLNAEQMEYICEINQEVNLKDKEIERLNNIIIELEKELEDMATLKTDKYGNTRKITHVDINWLLIKIKELKGVDKE